MNVENVRPLIVPQQYVSLGVPAASAPLRAEDLALSWVELTSKTAMLYVTPPRALEWDHADPAWRDSSLAAMRRADAGRVWTHEKRVNGVLHWVSMMHDDGLGSSRLLLTDELERTFAAGYLVALPDRSCGLAISRQSPDLDQIRAMVAGMHAGATIPMIQNLRDPAELLLAAG